MEPARLKLRLICYLWMVTTGLVFPIVHAATPAISAGSTHSVALNADGTIRAWGNDAGGQLGVGRSLASANPITVAGATDVTAIASGYSHVLALKADGTVLAWGNNSSGQLGDGTTTNRSTPVRVIGLSGVTAIWAGGSHSLALSGGSVWVWGANGTGQLGDGNYDDRSIPFRLSGLIDVLALSGGSSFTMALTRDGSVWAWGANSAGQLGDGTRTALYTGRSTPAPVIGLSGIADIAAGGEHSVARKADGTVWTWGNNNRGQLGDGTIIDRLTPVQVTGLSGVLKIAAGFSLGIAIKGDGTVLAWGGNGYAELGDGTDTDRLMPVPLTGLNGATSISTGFFHSIAVIAGGTIVAWGNNEYGELGDGTLQQRRTPAPVNGITGIRAVAVGDIHSVALKTDGTVLTWGDNASGQLGNGAFIFRSTPIPLALTGATRISAGGAHTVALKADGSVLAWGDNRAGQLGDGTAQNRALPTAVTGLGIGSSISAISAGGLYTLALKADGTVLAWGSNFSSQLGDRSNPDTSVAAQVLGLTGVLAIAAGAEHSVALNGDGTVSTWGRNNAGQLGNGTTTTGYAGRPTPARVNGLTGVIAIAAGFEHSVALKDDGTVRAWGSNNSGQLGDGTNIDRLTPVQVGGLVDVISIAAGDAHTLALKRDGTVWAWGANYAYQLGDGTTNGRLLPVQVGGLAGIIAIAASSHSLALKGDGTVMSWGASSFGKLGDGTLVDRSSPVVVLRENGTGSIAANNWFLDLNPVVAKSIPAEKIPLFLAVAISAGSNITTSIQYREADIGTAASTYVFALAPSSLVKGAALKGGADPSDPAYHIKLKATPAPGVVVDPKEGPLGCVLAQLNAAGQLTAVSASNLQAYITGVLAAGGAAVTVLNNISAAAIQGSTFYVGYGATGTSMINNGVNRSVVTVPGSQNCQPQAPQTGWWWDPTQRDRGYGIEVRGNKLYWTSFINNPTGIPSWTVASGPTALDGSLFQATLYSVANGQTLSGNYKPADAPKSEGLITLSFATTSQGTTIWPWGNRNVERMAFIPNGLTVSAQATQPENGWWWNVNEPYRGYFIEWQNGYASVTGYMYDDAGRPVWYQSMAATTDPRQYIGTWWIFGNGYPLTPAGRMINPKLTRLTDNFASLSIRFSDAANATLTLPTGRNIAITRLRF